MESLTGRVAFASARRPDKSALAWAAVLHCGPTALLGGRNALVLHGWRAALSTPFDVVVPVTSHVRERKGWLRVRRLAKVPDSNASPPRVAVHKSVIQAAGWARTDREAIYVVVSALQQRLTAPDHLLNRLPRNAKRARMIREMVTEYRSGIQSLNELDFAGLCRRCGLPEPTRQVLVRDSRGRGRSIDVQFEVGRLVLRVEIEGIGHLDPDEWLDDIDRHNAIVLTGSDAYLRVASLTIRDEPQDFVRMLGEALATLRRRGAT